MNLGTKAENLMKLQRSGFKVPPFFILDDENINSILEKKTTTLFKKKFDDWRSAHQVKKVAVRSSADVEDTADRSYAGQFKTVLEVDSFEDVLIAIKDITQSQSHLIYDRKSAKINIIIQKMIRPDSAGVIFTQDPTGLSADIIINSSFGLGNKVVEGDECDQYFVSKETGKIKSKIAQAKKIVFDGKTTTTDKPSLDHKHIVLLRSAASRIEQIFDAPQDIEWGIVGDDLYILQSRPITRLEKIRVWDSSNISESYPGITLPLTISVARRAYASVYKSQARLSGISWHEIEENQRLFESMIGSFRGRLYYNLDSWYQYISLFPNAKLNQEFFDKMIATSGQAIYRPAKTRSLLFKIKYILHTIQRTLFFKKEVKNFYDRVESHFKALGKLGASKDPDMVLSRYLSIESNLLPYWGTTVDNDFLAMIYNGFLSKLCTKWLSDRSQQLQSQLISGIQNVESVMQAVTLSELGDKLREDQNLANLIKENKFSAVWQQIEASPLKELFNAYIDRFGNRFALDLKLEVENKLSKPEGLLEMLKAYIELPSVELRSHIDNQRKISVKIEADTLSSLKFYERPIFRLVLNRLKMHIRNREKMRLLRSKVFQVARITFQRLGEILSEQKYIDLASDIFYLEIDEILQFVNGSLTIDTLRPLVKIRREEYTAYLKDQQLAERFATKGLPKNQSVPQLHITSGLDLTGMVCSVGLVTGRATVMLEPVIPTSPIEILVTRHTDPGWTPIIALSKGIIVERGGLLSHAAIITRELGIPCIIGVEAACEIIKTGDLVTLDAISGKITIHKS